MSMAISLRERDAAQAAADAARAAQSAGVTIRLMQGDDEERRLIGVLDRIWGRRPENPMLPREFMRVLSKAGHYIVGAFDGDELIGGALGIHSTPGLHTLHSHIAGVLPAYVSRSVGYAIKLHQRSWALEQEIDTIEWTFDPLVSRNANFNIRKLGATPVEYLENFYGAMDDSINAGDASDRLLVRWDLRDDRIGRLARGERLAPLSKGNLVVKIPDDIESLRRTDASQAQAWRQRIRAALSEPLRTGARVVGFERGVGYLLETVEEKVER